MDKPNQICPHCRKPILTGAGVPADNLPANNPFFPFCCKRCQLADLYGWLDEQYRIPAEDRDLDEDLDGPPSGPDAAPPQAEDIDNS